MKSAFLLFLLIAGSLATDTFTFPNDWKVKYSIANDRITFEMTGVNRGHVSLGVGGHKMNGLDIASFLYSDSKIQA